MRSAAGGETGAPRSQRGTRLKATTDRAFLVSAGFPSAGVATEEACSSLPAVRNGGSPIPIQGSTSGSRAHVRQRVPIARGRRTPIRIIGRFAAP